MDQISSYASLAASIIASMAFFFGIWQFNRTQKLTRETKAIELFLRFNDLNKELHALNQDFDSNFWQHNALLFLTEAIFKLTKGDKSWYLTVVWMIEAQKPFLLNCSINESTFSKDFIKLIKKETGT